MMKTARSALLALLFASLSMTTGAVAADESQKAVLVTGATSGIGLRIAERLAAEGFFVYAGARKQ